MKSLVIKRVLVTELPEVWRATLSQSVGATVTVRIEEDAQMPLPVGSKFVTDDPAFGIWRDREDMPDLAAYVSNLRAALQPRRLT